VEEKKMNEKEKKTINYIQEQTPPYSDYHTDLKKKGMGTEKLIEINSLECSGYILKKPFYIKILRGEDTLVGEIEELELYAFGDNNEEIIHELKMDLVDLYEHYCSINNEKLGDKPRKWKKILCEKIEDER
jgi:hypothetical protein